MRLISLVARVALIGLLFATIVRGAQSAPANPVARPEKGRRAVGDLLAGQSYEGKNASGAMVLMEFLDPIRVLITIGPPTGQSLEALYFLQGDSVTIRVGSDKVVWTRKGDALESKADGETITRLTRRSESADNDPAVAAALTGLKFTAQNSVGRTLELQFLDRGKARLTLGVGAPLECTYRANATRVIVMPGTGIAFLFTRDGDALESKVFDATPLRFVKQ